MTLPPVTPSGILAQADEALLAADYQQIDLVRLSPDARVINRAYEDLYAVVGLATFDSVENLLTRWPDAQGELVELVSQFISRDDAKSWDAYLCLLTPGLPLPEQTDDLRSVRYDTNRVRKIAVTGSEIRSISDVGRGLLPLLPLDAPPGDGGARDPLEELPELLAEFGVDPATTSRLIDAYARQQPLVDAIHRSGESAT